jgi:WD40 repeat protein
MDKIHSLCQWNIHGEKIFDWTITHRVEDLAISPDGRWLVAMDHGPHIHVYNFVTRDLEYEIDLQTRLTSVSISADSKHLLINHQEGIAQLFDLANRELVQQYTGHMGGKYLIRSDFGGANESFVMSGSEGTSAPSRSASISS